MSSFIYFFTNERAFYRNSLQHTGEEKEVVKDDRTLKSYLCPSLALTSITLRLGSKKVGSYFCSVDPFDVLTAQSKAPDSSSMILLPAEREAELNQLSCFFKQQETVIRTFEWSLSSFISQVPKKLCLNVKLDQDAVWLLRRAKAHARILNQTYLEQWPYNPVEVPEDLSSVTNTERQVVTRAFNQLEQLVFSRTRGSARGPLLTSLSAATFGQVKKPYRDAFAQLGMTTS